VVQKTRCEARFRNRHEGIEFRLEGKAKFPVPHRQTRKPEGSAEATHIPDDSDSS